MARRLTLSSDRGMNLTRVSAQRWKCRIRLVVGDHRSVKSVAASRQVLNDPRLGRDQYNDRNNLQHQRLSEPPPGYSGVDKKISPESPLSQRRSVRHGLQRVCQILEKDAVSRFQLNQQAKGWELFTLGIRLRT
jgi:hypothetical protein